MRLARVQVHLKAASKISISHQEASLAQGVLYATFSVDDPSRI